MQIRLRLTLATALLCAGTAWTSAPSAPQDRYAEFLIKFRQAMAINAQDEMGKLVREYQEEAVGHVVETCKQIGIKSSDDLETLIDGLRKGWDKAFGTRFVDTMYEYYSLLEPSLKREQQRLAETYERLRVRAVDLGAKRDGPGLELTGNELHTAAEGFELVGDRYHASQAWLVYAQCFDEALRGPNADLKKATVAYGKAVELRRAIGLEDSQYATAKVRHEHLVAQGWVDEVPPPADGAGGATDAPAAGATPGAGAAAAAAPPVAALTAELRFDLLETLDEIARPNYSADDFYQMWTGLFFQGKSSLAQFQAIKEGPSFVRSGSAEVVWDKDKDGADDDDPKVPLTGNLSAFEVVIGQGEEARGWGFLAVTGLEKDQYQNVAEISLAPDDNQMVLYAVGAGSMVGDVAGTPLRVIDDNMDGFYGSLPVSWGYTGLSRDMFQPELDSIVVGDSKRALPWSEYQKIGTAWYRLEPELGGKRLKATPAEVRTGTLQLAFEGPKPTWLVVRGEAKNENCYFDLVAGGSKGIEVPIGRYSLFCGEVRKGKKRQAMKALILPGKTSTPWTVEEGVTTKVELGGPFSFDFRFARNGETVTVEGPSVVVTGKAGERYERAWNSVPRPEVLWRKAGGKRGSKGGEMAVVADIEGITQHSFAGAWSPLDMTVDVKGIGADEKVELQLVEEKNPLFGSVESSWKE